MRNLFFSFLFIFSFTVGDVLARGITDYNDERFSLVSSYLKDFDRDYSILSVRNENEKYEVKYAIIFPHSGEVQRGKEFKLISLYDCPEDFNAIPSDIACFGKLEKVDEKGKKVKYAPMKLLGKVEFTDEANPVAKIAVYSENVKGIISDVEEGKKQVSNSELSIKSIVNVNLGSSTVPKPFYRLSSNF